MTNRSYDEGNYIRLKKLIEIASSVVSIKLYAAKP
jgi:hypothetical protein